LTEFSLLGATNLTGLRDAFRNSEYLLRALGVDVLGSKPGISSRFPVKEVGSGA